MFAVSRRAEQCRLLTHHHIFVTTEDPVLRTEMTNLESQEEDVPKRASLSPLPSPLDTTFPRCGNPTHVVSDIYSTVNSLHNFTYSVVSLTTTTEGKLSRQCSEFHQ